MHVSAIIAAGGRGERLGGSLPKQFLRLGDQPILQRGLEVFLESDRVTDIVVALPPDVAANVPAYLRDRRKPIAIVEGGARRQDSVANAFDVVKARAEVVVIHDAARPFVTTDLISRIVDAARDYGAAIAALQSTDTVKRVDTDRFIAQTLPRSEIFLAQTPQAFRTGVLEDALRLAGSGLHATDEAALAEAAGYRVRLVEGDRRNLKITTTEDLKMAETLAGEPGGRNPRPQLRVGTGYDLHRLVPGRPLILGGVTIPFEKGLMGHSDADVVCHALTDAILGAAGAGDIGHHFPDTDARWKDADSLALLAQATGVVAAAGFAVVNVDIVVIAERPKLMPYLDEMKAKLSSVLGVTAADVSVKGKTNEGVDSMGRGESIAVHAVALVSRRESAS